MYKSNHHAICWLHQLILNQTGKNRMWGGNITNEQKSLPFIHYSYFLMHPSIQSLCVVHFLYAMQRSNYFFICVLYTHLYITIWSLGGAEICPRWCRREEAEGEIILVSPKIIVSHHLSHWSTIKIMSDYGSDRKLGLNPILITSLSPWPLYHTFGAFIYFVIMRHLTDLL